MSPTELSPVGWRWPNFSYGELARASVGMGIRMEPAFLDRLQDLRDLYRKPMILTSAYRSPEYNVSLKLRFRPNPTPEEIQEWRVGPHTTGRAVDVRVFGADAYRLVGMAINIGFTGIGDRQHGDHARRFIHLDDLEDAPGRPRPWMWSYGN